MDSEAIARHPIRAVLARVQARHDEGRATRALAAPRDDVEIRFVRHSASLMAALGHAGVDPADPVILPLLRQAAHTCARLFELAPSDFASGIRWLDGFLSGLIARDGESLDALAAVSLDRVRASGVGIDECAYGLIDGLQRVWRGAPGTEDVLVSAMKATDPAAVRVGPVDLVLKVRVPEIMALFRVVQADRAGLDDVLRKGLDGHRSYWSRVRGAEAPRGYVSLGLTAICALAVDRGMEPGVVSDYLPKSLWGASGRA